MIVGGLAEGINSAAHNTAIATGGKTIAVIGTPLNKVYPHKNFELQQKIMDNHLGISQFSIGHPTTPKDFVLRNRTMALISDATIIVEAGDMSGSLHQGWEALRLGRPLFIQKSIFNNTQLAWPKKMRDYGAMELIHMIYCRLVKLDFTGQMEFQLKAHSNEDSVYSNIKLGRKSTMEFLRHINNTGHH